jgi:hypothetical protein
VNLAWVISILSELKVTLQLLASAKTGESKKFDIFDAALRAFNVTSM